MRIERKEYIIRPVVKQKFSGISSLPKTKTSYDSAQLDRTGAYKTGLTVEEEKEYEKELGFEKGSLNRKNGKFWGHIGFTLNNDKPTYISVISLEDELKFRALLQNSKIASSELEIKKNPNVEFYVEDKEVKAKIEELDANMEMEALDAFTNTTAEEKKGLLKILTSFDKNPLKGIDNLSETIIKTELYKRVKGDPKRFLELTNDKDLDIRIMIQNLLEKGMLTKKQNYYIYEGETLGSSIDGVIEFFKDPKKQSIKIALTKDLKNKSKGE